MFKKGIIILLVTLMMLILSLSVMAFGEDESGSFYSEDTGPDFTYSGEINPSYRVFNEKDNNFNFDMNLDLKYQADNYDLIGTIDYTRGARREVELSEAYLQYYAGDYHLLLGRKKLVWGKGDKVHVVDKLNGEDMSDFINNGYLDRQIGETMLKVDRYFNNGRTLLEFVYTPGFTPHRISDNPDSALGNWIINPIESVSLAKLSQMTGYSTEEIVRQVETNFPDYHNQVALHYTDNKDGLDYGFTYYHGYLREPSYNKSVLLTALQNPRQVNQAVFQQLLIDADLHYDPVDMLGAEMAAVWNTINTRFELAYFRTDDNNGSDPEVRNSKIAWVIGGDRDLALSNLNLNIQLTGEKILNSEYIKTNGMVDIQYDKDGDYLTNRLIVNLSDSYQNQTIKPEISWIYNILGKDYSIEGKVDYAYQDDLHFILSHKLFSGDEGTTFGQFNDNDYTSIGMKYSF